MNIDGYFGETITHTQPFSIFDYADRINAGAYTAEAKALVNSARTYIKTARNYAADGTLPYPESTNTDITAIKGTADSFAPASASDAVNAVFSSISLSVDERIRFVFYIKPEANDTVTFTYRVNTHPTSVTVNTSDCNGYYEIALRAVDLRSPITIDLASTGEGVDYTYKLAYYVYYAKNTVKDDNLVTLLDALWAYSVATRTYLESALTDSPAVNLSVSGNTVNAENYVIVADDSCTSAAEALRDAIYSKTGQNLAIVSEAPEGKNCIYVNLESPNHTYDFKVSVSDSDMMINCSFKSFMGDAMRSFIEEYIRSTNTSFNFSSDFVKNYYTDRIYYSDFGILGVDIDSLAETYGSSYRNISSWYGDALAQIKPVLQNDLLNIKAAHDFANISARHTICADDGAVYYIADADVKTNIVVETPVDFGTAHFVIDNTDLVNSNTHVFVVKSTQSAVSITDPAALRWILMAGLNSKTSSIDLGLGYPAMLVTTNGSHKIYRRQNYDEWQGNSMTELILIDKDGNVDPSTPVMFDYTNLDSILAYRLDIPTLTVRGGNFTTISCTTRKVIHRGIEVQRPNTRVENLNHSVIGEYSISEQNAGNVGSLAYGFFVANNTSNVTFYNCTLQARRFYQDATYEIVAKMSNNVTFENCTQSNFYVDKSTYLPVTSATTTQMLCMTNSACWGAMESDFCKNLSFVNSTISRFDAHQGLYNGRIIGSTVQGIEIVGGGEFLLEDSDIVKYGGSGVDTYAQNSLIFLRDDYASSWNGTITIKDARAHLYEDANCNYEKGNAYKSAVIFHSYRNWYNGCTAHFPSIVVDNLTYHSTILGRQITASEMGPVDLITSAYSFGLEPDMHLSQTQNTPSIYPDVDSNGDGYVDGTNISYDGTADKSGVTDESSKKNLNPVVPPEKILILNNSEGYDFGTRILEYMKLTTFFDNTTILAGITGEDGKIIPTVYYNSKTISNNDSPLVPFN